MSTLKLALLGGFHARIDPGGSIVLPTKKTKTLLTYLALHPGQSYGRETLATLFWGNTPNAQARGSLRQAIAAVRRALLGRGTGVLGTEGDTVALAAEAVHTDVAEFKRLLDDGGLENLERGLALYRGELLQGFSFREEGLEEWLWVEREQLREMALTGLDKLLWHHVEVGAVELGIAVGSRLLALDPLREEVHRAMMGLYLEQGRRPSALRQYQICRELLERELGVEPEAETERIYEQARRSISKPRFSGSSATGRNAARGAEEDARDEVGIPPNGELRQVTVLFAELAEFARLSGKLGVEQIHMLLGRYLDVVDDVVHRYGGVVSAHIGDTVMAMFGYPRAHEDDAQRAVQAGLELVEAISESESKGWSDEFALAVQVAISTGLVVAERSVSGDEGVVGAPVTVATRLLSVAEPGSVVIGQATRRLVDGLFICEGLGHQDLRGLSEPVAAYRVRGQSGAPSRFEATADRGLTPLVGRKAEIALLWDRWRQVENGEGQVVLLSGEAGIGKSRIVREFRDRLASFQVLYYCSPYHTNTMLYPAIKQLERALGFERGDSGQQKLDKLEAMVQSHGLAVQETVPLLAPLLSLPLSDRYSVPVLSRPVQKQRTLETLVALVGAMAEREPVLMVVEDVHWIDPTTLELLGQFTERAHTARILLVITFRPEFEPPWSGYPHLTLHTLNNLGREESCLIVDRVAGGKTLPTAVMEQILENTDGVPLYVEELTKTVLDSDLLVEAGNAYVLSAQLPSLEIPASLQNSLTERLDRLGPAKIVAQMAAAIGRSFGHELLAQISQLREQALSDALSQLNEAGMIHRHGRPPDVRYDFKHVLVQEAAYHSLLKGKRQEYHLRIAEVLETSFPDTVETEPETLAFHYAEAGRPDPAVTYWQRAGEQAVRRSACLVSTAEQNWSTGAA